MPLDRYPQVRGIPAKFDSLNVGNLAPLTERGNLEAGRIHNVQHLFGDEVEVTSGTALEGMSVIIGVNPTKTSSALLECIDATAVSQGSHSGTIQTFNAAVSKSSTTTTALAICQALWPAYSITAGTVTALYGLYVYGNSSATGGTIGTQTGIAIAEITRTATIACGQQIIMPSGGGTNIGLLLTKNAGNTQANIWFQDNGTGYVIMQAQNSTTTWTFQLPPDDGDSGEQLQTNGSGVTTWEGAASTREVKVLHGVIDGDEALQRIRSAPVYRFHYDRNATRVGGDYDTEFVGIVADEAPWAMKHNGRIFNPINAFGHAAAAIQALAAKVEALEAKVA